MPVATLPFLRRLWLVSGFGLAFASFAGAASAADVTVEVSGARSTQGIVGATLYDAASWMKADLMRAQTPAGPRVELVFRNVPPGRYAIAVIHDENANGKLDTYFFGLPSEPYGFSRDARGRFGPPDFADAAFDVQGDVRLTVKMR